MPRDQPSIRRDKSVYITSALVDVVVHIRLLPFILHYIEFETNPNKFNKFAVDRTLQLVVNVTSPKSIQFTSFSLFAVVRQSLCIVYCLHYNIHHSTNMIVAWMQRMHNAHVDENSVPINSIHLPILIWMTHSITKKKVLHVMRTRISIWWNTYVTMD